MGQLVQLYPSRVYHGTAREDVPKILVEGLRPLGKNRTKEIQVVDHAFDLVAAELGIPYRRTGIFAWPERKLASGTILEVAVDPTRCIVLHQAWMDLAWGIMDNIAERIRNNQHPEAINLPAAQLFDLLRLAMLHEGRFDEVLFRLAANYWTTAQTLDQYDPHLMNLAVRAEMVRFPNLLPNLAHEVLLADAVVEKERIRLLTVDELLSGKKAGI